MNGGRRSGGRATGLDELSGILVLAGLILVLAVLEPRFFTAPNLLNILRQASPLAIAALGQAVVVIAGGIDLAQGSAAALVGMLALMAAKSLNAAHAGWMAIPLLGMLLGAVNGLLVARYRVPAFVATVGMLTYARGMAYYLGGGLPIEFPPAGYNWPGQGYVGPIPAPVIMAAVAFAGTHLLMTRTTLGRMFYAIGGNARTAALSGINVERVRILSFMVGGLLTGLAALVLSGRVNSAPPNLSPNLPFEAIAAIAIGGISMAGGEGKLWKGMVGVGIISVLTNGLNLLGVSTYIQLMIIGLVTIGAVALDNAQREGLARLFGSGRPVRSAAERGPSG